MPPAAEALQPRGLLLAFALVFAAAVGVAFVLAHQKGLIVFAALGSDVAIKTADVALMGNDLRHLPRFVALSDRTLRIINQNLLWGLGFIAVFFALSALGFVIDRRGFSARIQRLLRDLQQRPPPPF